mgnify:CR=1 FL=1
MDTGMLWFDNDPQSDLQSKVNRAAAYYRKKYGKSPNMCFVHPSMMTQVKLEIGTIATYPNPSVIPHHFWIGIQPRDPQRSL